MSALDDLQTGGHSAKEGLDSSVAALAGLEKQTDDLAQQFAALGTEGSAQVLAESATSRLSSAQQHLAAAHQDLDEFIADCEQAKGA